MQKSYLTNYIQTYLWHGLSVILNLASMFIVIPMITEDKIVYGIYSVCISTAIFLNYADIGFVRAGLKYAGESFARGDYKTELKLYGLSSFVVLIFVSIVAIIYFVFSYYPAILIRDISETTHISIASSLLFIQAIFSFNTVLQRYVTGVFQVRIQQYIYQRIAIIGSLFKITSVYFYFSPGKYDIVGYFLFIKIIDLLILLFGVWIIQKKYHLLIIDFIKSVRYDREVYAKTKKLAFSSLFVTATWIIYYELDLIIIGKWFGATEVAIFALAFTFTKFLRSLSSIIYGPFQTRYNHMIGLGDTNSVKVLVEKVIFFTMPIFVLPIISIGFLSKNIVLTWAGGNFSESSFILAILSFNFMFSFITIPGSNILVAFERIKEMYLLSAISVLLYWIGIHLTIDSFGILSFAIFKFATGTMAMLYYLKILLHFTGRGVADFLKNTILPILLPIIIQIVFLTFIIDYLPLAKGKINLLFVIGVGGISTLLGGGALYLVSEQYRIIINSSLRKLYR